MKKVELDTYNWRYIRLALSLALFKREHIVIRNGFKFIEKNYDLLHLFNCFKKFVFDADAGIISDSEEDIIFNPEGMGSDIYNFDCDEYFPISEIELFIMPSLFHSNYRSAVNYRGVTHSHISYPTTVIKTTLFDFLERMGFYGSFNLKRFGFYGSGGGIAESKIYQMEPKICDDLFSFNECKLEGVKIFMAKMNMDMAQKEKEFIVKHIGIPENSVQIMEIVDADGFGNSIQAYTMCNGMNIILSKDMDLYNSAGDFIFDENKYYRALSGFVQEVELISKLKKIPQCYVEEILPYMLMTGSAINDEIMNYPAYSICREFLP
jgi:RNA 3'-terminal phosphate cyclase